MAYTIDDWQQLVIAFKQLPELFLDWLSKECYEHKNTFIMYDTNVMTRKTTIRNATDFENQRNLGKRELILLIREWMAKDPLQPPENF